MMILPLPKIKHGGMIDHGQAPIRKRSRISKPPIRSRRRVIPLVKDQIAPGCKPQVQRDVPIPRTSHKNKYRRRVERALNKKDDFLVRLNEVAGAGDWRKYRYLAFQFMRDDQVKLAALHERNSRASQRYRISNKCLKNLIPEVDVAGPERRQGTVRRVRKSSGGWRHVVRFDLIDQATQQTVKWALEPWITRHRILNNQHAVMNGGHQAACRAVLDEIRDRPELKFAVLADISDQYNSFDEDNVLAIMPAQAGVVRGTILSDAYTYISRNGSISLSHSQVRKLRQGIPQGSVVSPLVAEVLMAAILESVDLGDFFIRVSADNIIVLAKTRKDANWIEEVLVAAFERSPAGRLRLRTCVRRVADGFTYLGYMYRRRKGAVTIGPSRKNKAKFCRKYWFRMIEYRRKGRRLPMERLKKGIKSWCSAFPLWDENQRRWWEMSAIANLEWIKDCPPEIVRGVARLVDGRDVF